MREKIRQKINFRLFWWSRKHWIMELSSDEVNQFRHRNPKKAQFANVGVEAIQWNFIFIHNPSWGHFMSWKTNNHRLHHDLIIYQINLNYRDSKIVIPMTHYSRIWPYQKFSGNVWNDGPKKPVEQISLNSTKSK